MKLFSYMAMVVAFGALLIAQACSNVRLVPGGTPSLTAQGTGEVCTRSPSDISRSTKFLFVVDKSGSNANANGGNPPSDPQNVRRAGNIERFFNSELARGAQGQKWAMVGFNGGNASRFYTPDPQEFSDVEARFRGSIAKLRGDADANATPYQAALGVTSDIIRKDIADNPTDESYYMIFFMSDGVPTDLGQAGVAGLENTIKTMMKIRPGRIFMSTVFYGPPVAAAIDTLSKMAEFANGKFINLEQNENFDFGELVVRPSKEPWQFKQSDLVVYNLNAGFCMDGTVDVDSDADGACDKDEVKYGLDPTARFSLTDSHDPGNPNVAVSQRRGTARNMTQGVGDFFRMREILVPGATLDSCPSGGDTLEDGRSDEDGDLLTKCEERIITNGSPAGTERRNGDPKNPDTDGDGFLDGIEVFATSRYATALDNRDLVGVSYDGEPEDAATQIREHRHPMMRDPGAFKYDTTLTPRPMNADGQTCYSFAQSRLQVFPTAAAPESKNIKGLGHAGNQNMILSYFIQTPQSDPRAVGTVMSNIQRLVYSRADSILPLRLETSLFKAYVVPVD
ncbi:MAG: hypothetical protein K2X47_05885 [Bdellovibrionales bacterium]|nr:hypothetical protein [Bdellovibrionales bacterium]